MSKYDFFSTEITFSDWYLKINILGKGILLFFFIRKYGTYFR